MEKRIPTTVALDSNNAAPTEPKRTHDEVANPNDDSVCESVNKRLCC